MDLFVDEITKEQSVSTQIQQYSKESPSEKKKKYVDRLKFLKPCKKCGGRYFTHCRYTGFHCSDCHPEIIGDPAYALGNPDQNRLREAPPKKETPKSNGICEKALIWTNTNLKELLKAGWTRPELYRRGKLKRPYGNWGVIWLSVWSREGVRVKLDKQSSRIIFSFTSGNREISQSASPTTILCRKNRAE